MYLTIPSKKNIDMLKDLPKYNYETGLVASYDSINGFSLAKYDICLSDKDSIEDDTCSIYEPNLDSIRTFYLSINKERFFPLYMVGRANDIIANGKKVEGFNDDKYTQYICGIAFSQVKNFEDINKVLISINDLEKTDKKAPILVDANGDTVFATIYHSKILNKNFLFLTSENEILKEAQLSSVSMSEIENHNLIICEEVPLRWLVSKKDDTAISIDSPMVTTMVPNYAKSKLKKMLNSSEFQELFEIDKSVKKKKTNPFKVGLPTLDSQIKKAIDVGMIPFLVGPPGVGKTEIIESQSKHVLRYNMARFTPTSFTGKDYVIPGDVVTYEENGKTITKTTKALTGSAEPEWLQDVKKALEESKVDGEKVILFLDEFDKLTPSLQVFINGIIDDNPTLGGWKIPKGVSIVLAGNTTVDSLASNKISSEVSSRLVRINVNPNVDEWLKWAIKEKIDPIVISYIKTYPNDILTKEVGRDGRVDPSLSMNPRKWAKMVSRELACSRVTGLNLMLDNYMSEQQIKKFMDFIDHYYDNSIEEILAGDTSNFTIESVDQNVFVTSILTVITDKSKLKEILNLFSNEELRKFFLSAWVSYHENDKSYAYQVYEEFKLEREALTDGYSK